MKPSWVERFGVGALLLVPLAPLAVCSGILFPYTSGRNFFFRTLVLIAFSAWFLLRLREPERFKPRWSLVTGAVLAFVTILGIATALAPNPSLAFWSTLERMDGLVNILFLSVFFFTSVHLLTERTWRIFFHVSFGTALVVSMVALLQLSGFMLIHQGGVRIDATFGNASFFAAYLILSAGLAMFLCAREVRRRLAYAVCAGLFVFFALASATRSAFIALPAALATSGIAAFFLRKESMNIKRFGIVAFATLALLLGSFFALRHTPLVTHPLVGRLLSVSLSGSDAEARLLSWKLALEGAQERLLFGWGPEGFRSVFIKYYDPQLGGREQWFDRAHNMYLDWLVQAGACGLLAYLALWFGLSRAVWRRESGFSAWEKIALSGMFAGYAAFNMFSFDTITASILFFSFLAFVDSQSALQRARFEKLSPPFHQNEMAAPPPQFFKTPRLRALCIFLYSVIIFVTLFIFYFAIAKPALAARYIWLGLQSDSPSVDTRLGYFTRAISLNSFATPEAREMLAQFAVDVSQAPLGNESRAKIVSLATEELSRQIETTPNDQRYLVRMGVVLNAYRDYAEAVPFLERAVALSPHKQASLYELGTSYLNLGQFDKAAEVFKRAAELLPDHEDLESKRLYAVSLVYASRFAESESYMQRIFGRPLLDRNLDLLADAYRRVGAYAKESYVRGLLEKERASK